MQQIFDSYLQKALYQTKLEDLKEKHLAKGFIPIDDQNDETQFDLVLKHRETGKMLVFEIVWPPLASDKMMKIDQLRHVAKKSNYESRLISIIKPAPVEIEIDWLPDAFFQYINEYPPEDIENKATHIIFENAEIFINSINVVKHIAYLDVEGSIEVKLLYGSESDRRDGMGDEIEETFPFTANLEADLRDDKILKADIEIDSTFW